MACGAGTPCRIEERTDELPNRRNLYGRAVVRLPDVTSAYLDTRWRAYLGVDEVPTFADRVGAIRHTPQYAGSVGCPHGGFLRPTH